MFQANQNIAQGEDGACEIFGCTLINFPNYNPLATIDDASCSNGSQDVYGCSNSNFVEYDASCHHLYFSQQF